jgi:hypothetical protein
MKIEYISHACLRIDTGDARIVTDPWFEGSAYAGQWHVFPKPVTAARALEADCILISHGHEDHLHPPTLERMPKAAPVYFPYNWYGSVKEYLEDLGFQRVREAMTNKRIAVGKSTFVTFIANNLDSLMVVESDGRVLVDVNDSLHAHHPRVIDLFAENIRRAWPKIDVVFCGFGGASYFPNTVHVAGKDDETVGRLREQFFVHNFCRIAAALAPRVAVPFAADFALLEANKDWMNRIRFPRERIADYFRENFPDAAKHTNVLAMYPGDVLDGETLIPNSPYRADIRDGDLSHLIESQYEREIEQARQIPIISEQRADQLREKILENVSERAKLFRPERLAALRFCVEVTDVAENPFYHVRFRGGVPDIRRSGAMLDDEGLRIAVSSRILEYSFGSTWGGDAITIGYACDIEIRDKSLLAKKLDTVCVRLLTRHPLASRYMMKQPWRAARFLWSNPLTRKWAIRRLRQRDNLDSTYDANLWLARTKCEVCQVCNMPLLDAKFGSTL